MADNIPDNIDEKDYEATPQQLARLIGLPTPQIQGMPAVHAAPQPPSIGQPSQAAAPVQQPQATAPTTSASMSIPNAPTTGMPPVKPVTPAQPVTAQTEEQQTALAQQKLAQLQAQKPAIFKLQDKANEFHQSHPGVLGRMAQIGAGIARGVETAGEALAPGIAAAIPGTQVQHAMAVRQAQSGVAGAESAQKSAAESEKAKADAHKAMHPGSKAVGTPYQGDDGYMHQAVQDEQGGMHDQPLLDANNQPVKGEKLPGAEKHDLKEMVDTRPTMPDGTTNPNYNKPVYGYLTPDNQPVYTSALAPPKAETGAQDQQHFEKILGQLHSEGLAFGKETDPHALAAAASKSPYLKAHPEEAQFYAGYTGARPTPGTHVAVSLQTGEATAQRNLEHKDVLVQRPDGSTEQMSGADAMRQYGVNGDFTVLAGSQASKNRDTVANAVGYVQQLSRYEQDYRTYSPKLTADDRRGMEVLSRNEPKVAGELAGVLESIPLLGPINAMTNNRMMSVMVANGYSNMSEGGKKLMADYFNTLVGNFADSKRRLGGIGRNDSLILSEMHTIPLPYLDLQSAEDQFEAKFTDLKSRNAELPHIAGLQHPNDIKLLEQQSENRSSVRIGGQDIKVNNGTFSYGGHTYKVNPDGRGGTLVK